MYCMYVLLKFGLFRGCGSPYIVFIWTSGVNARPIYIYIYIYIYNMDLKKSLIIENLYNSNREV